MADVPWSRGRATMCLKHNEINATAVAAVLPTERQKIVFSLARVTSHPVFDDETRPRFLSVLRHPITLVNKTNAWY